MRACPDVRVQCMCALINWCWLWSLKLGLAFWTCALLVEPVIVGVCPLLTFDLWPRPIYWPGRGQLMTQVEWRAQSGGVKGCWLCGGGLCCGVGMVECHCAFWCWPGCGTDFWWLVKTWTWWCVLAPPFQPSSGQLNAHFRPRPCSGRDWMRVVILHLMDNVICAPSLISLVLHLNTCVWNAVSSSVYVCLVHIRLYCKLEMAANPWWYGGQWLCTRRLNKRPDADCPSAVTNCSHQQFPIPVVIFHLVFMRSQFCGRVKTILAGRIHEYLPRAFVCLGAHNSMIMPAQQV